MNIDRRTNARIYVRNSISTSSSYYASYSVIKLSECERFLAGMRPTHSRVASADCRVRTTVSDNGSAYTRKRKSSRVSSWSCGSGGAYANAKHTGPGVLLLLLLVCGEVQRETAAAAAADADAQRQRRAQRPRPRHDIAPTTTTMASVFGVRFRFRSTLTFSKFHLCATMVADVVVVSRYSRADCKAPHSAETKPQARSSSQRHQLLLLACRRRCGRTF